ncbi:MAG: hypothetical protein HQL99_09085 [Magnetococcales bacterium]|nr:hypothetical protein [Magnetococcales bacterium]
MSDVSKVTYVTKKSRSADKNYLLEELKTKLGDNDCCRKIFTELNRYCENNFNCEYDYKIPAPYAFLDFLLKNPDHLIQTKENFRESKETNKKREDLIFGNDNVRKDVQKEGLDELKKLMNNRKTNQRKWWIFEGDTQIDYMIDLGESLLFIVILKDDVPESTKWVEKRNKIVRIMEAVSENENRKPYKVIFCAKHDVMSKYALSEEAWWQDHLPHLKDDDNKIKELMSNCCFVTSPLSS